MMIVARSSAYCLLLLATGALTLGARTDPAMANGTIIDPIFADGFEPCVNFIWPTQAVTSGNIGGRSGADAMCVADYQAGPELGCTQVRAFISVSAADEIRDMPSNYGLPDCEIWRPDAVRVSPSWGSLIDGNNTIENQIAGPTGPSGHYWWSGSTAAIADGALAQNCQGWSFGSTGEGGSVGLLQVNSLFNGGLTCSLTANVTCICW